VKYRQQNPPDEWQALPVELIHEVVQHVRVMLMFEVHIVDRFKWCVAVARVAPFITIVHCSPESLILISQGLDNPGGDAACRNARFCGDRSLTRVQ
jgi:hypothetical protein